MAKLLSEKELTTELENLFGKNRENYSENTLDYYAFMFEAIINQVKNKVGVDTLNANLKKILQENAYVARFIDAQKEMRDSHNRELHAIKYSTFR